tara:strand:+ start:277 stop:519 length:243 start_codon:yes stop_codon:yes gene_type:complete
MLEDMQKMVQHIKNVVSGLLGSPKPPKPAEKHQPEKKRKPKPKPKKPKTRGKRARDAKGRYLKDDPNTPENEAYINEDDK